MGSAEDNTKAAPQGMAVGNMARDLWAVLRECEDRCDMELEDVSPSHVVWQLANVALAQADRTMSDNECNARGLPDSIDRAMAYEASLAAPQGVAINALRGLLEIEDARIAAGAFKPNAEAQKRIDLARAALAQAGQAAPATDAIEALPPGHLYRAINNLLTHIGIEGSIDSGHGFVQDCMDALHAVDGGVYLDNLAKAAPAGEGASARAPRRLRKMLSALQAGEMSVSRAIELLEYWHAGTYSDEQVPEPPEDSALITDDKFPMELVRELRAQLEALATPATEPAAPKAAPAAVETVSEREQFEECWQKLHGRKPTTWADLFDGSMLQQGPVPAHLVGRYFTKEAECGWAMWQARALATSPPLAPSDAKESTS